MTWVVFTGLLGMVTFILSIFKLLELEIVENMSWYIPLGLFAGCVFLFVLFLASAFYFMKNFMK